MPDRTWKHRCGSDDYFIWLGTEVCPYCGARGTYDGGGYSRIEAMGMYQLRTGFKPIGPHHPHADRLLGRLTRSCTACAGKGLLDIDNGRTWRDCPACKGLGAVLEGTAEEIAEARYLILESFPEAAVQQ
jgi:hypothetical protein